MKLSSYEDLHGFVEEADLVLIGLGQEWCLTYEIILQELNDKAPVLAEILESVAMKEEHSYLIAAIESYFYHNFCPDKMKGAYQRLFHLVNGKNYFIVSLTTDMYLEKFDFKNDRIVKPCGSFNKMQCDGNCNGVIYGMEELYTAVFLRLDELAKQNDRVGQTDVDIVIQEMEALINDVICSNCKEKIVFNTLDALKYNENGYLKAWEIYMKWLQGTVNKKLCIIEAGAGMELPSIIRWPFEKTALYNQKAKMIRIHKKFFQINEEISDRAYSKESNAIDFFSEM